MLGEGLIQECQFPTYRVEKSPENHVFGPQQGHGVQKWLESHNLQVLREVGVGTSGPLCLWVHTQALGGTMSNLTVILQLFTMHICTYAMKNSEQWLKFHDL